LHATIKSRHFPQPIRDPFSSWHLLRANKATTYLISLDYSIIKYCTTLFLVAVGTRNKHVRITCPEAAGRVSLDFRQQITKQVAVTSSSFILLHARLSGMYSNRCSVIASCLPACPQAPVQETSFNGCFEKEILKSKSRKGE
jgi:hypothetical protein